MKTHTASYVAVMLVGLGAFSTVPRPRTPVPQAPDPGARIEGDTIGGVVTGPSGPEAGVWVIAETRELATKFVKIVVTDDHGRYLLPDLPKATYRVWVRGYGLVDSPAVRAIVLRGGRPDLAGQALERVRAHTLMIVGGQDTVVLVLNRQACARMTGECRVHVIPGATHLFEETGALEEVSRLASDWFTRYLRERTEVRPERQRSP